MIDPHHGWNESFKPVIWGFLLSILLTLAAFWIAVERFFSGAMLAYGISLLAALQATFQLIFFFHIGLESKPRWNLIMFLFTLLVVVVVIGGSLWIMKNLSYNVMPEMNM